MLITGGLNDPRVTYWEPAKWAAKLRATKTDDNLLLLKINMGAGHGGKSGRWERLHEVAEAYAFVLTQVAANDPRPAARLLLADRRRRPPARRRQPVRVDRRRAAETLSSPNSTLREVGAGLGLLPSSPAASDKQSWRQQSWQVLTPGVRLERRGKFDALVGAGGRPVPRDVRVRLTPFTRRPRRRLCPRASAGREQRRALRRPFRRLLGQSTSDTLDTLPLGRRPRPSRRHRLQRAFRGRDLRLAGRRRRLSRRPQRRHLRPVRSPARGRERSGVATVIDSDLPNWIADDLADLHAASHRRC